MSALAPLALLAASSLPLGLALPTDGDASPHLVARDEKKGMSSTTKWIIIAVCVVAGILVLSFTLHFFRKWIGCGGERMRAKDAALSAMKDMNRPRPSNNGGGYYYGGGTAYPDQAVLHHQQQMDWERQQRQNNEWHEQNYGRY